MPGSTPELQYEFEVWRKLLHLFALSIPVGYHFVGHLAAILIPAVCFAVALFADLARLRRWSIQRFWLPITSPIIRPKESDNFTGATYILASGAICPAIFQVPAAAAGMAAIILGDIAAALIGRRWGTHRLVGNKTFEGSSGFLVAAFLGIVAVPGIGWPLALVAAVVGTIAEAISGKVDDNLSVPLTVGLTCHLWLARAIS
ncbi:MAG: hypothetical protein AB1752_12770 [Candidatus Zixiibacteriota bacterium]